MFVDEVTVEIKAGTGGNGSVSFRKEKFVPRGGPSGGDGGTGGDVVLEGDSNLSTLLDFRYQTVYPAARGGDGGAKDMYGKDSPDLVLKVPVGTLARDLATGRQLADVTTHGQRVAIAKGGRGGRGNAHFASSTHQAPRYAENGEPGEKYRVQLELKLLADVGIVGFPNVGKSSLIAAVSAARPKVADYPFTTLVPHLGVVRVDDDATRTFVMADIPGLIEGASEGVGLGHQFLRHIERTRLLVHVLDVSGLTGRDPLDDYAAINRELSAYSPALAALPQVVALNKVDVAPQAEVESLKATLIDRGLNVFAISAATGAGTSALMFELSDRLQVLKQAALRPEPLDDLVLITPDQMPGSVERSKAGRRRWSAIHDTSDGAYVVTGAGIERLVAMTPMENDHALERLQRVLDRAGIVRRLRELGAEQGDTVRIGATEFDFIDEDREE